MQKFSNLFVVSVTGNIAAGKTTLIEALKPLFLKDYPIVFLPEMHELPHSKTAQIAPDYFAISRSAARVETNDPSGQDLIELEFQLAILADLHTELSRLNTEALALQELRLVILERGWVDVGIFSELLFGKDSRNLKTVEDQTSVLFGEYADLTIFLHSDCEVSFERAKKRAQEDANQNATIEKFGDGAMFGRLEVLYHNRFRKSEAAQIACIAQYIFEPNPVEVCGRIDSAFCDFVRDEMRARAVVSVALDKISPMTRIDRNAKQASLYERLGIEVNKISKWVTGKETLKDMQAFVDTMQGLHDDFHKQISWLLVDTQKEAKTHYAKDLRQGYSIEFILHEQAAGRELLLCAPELLSDDDVAEKLHINENILTSRCTPIFYSLALCDTYGVVLSYYVTFAFAVGANCGLEIVSWDWYKQRQTAVK